jgi:hypothetical protein
VRFLWSPTSPCKPNVCPDWATMYPGDRYVDYVGMTGVNWGFPNTPYERRARPWAKWKNMVKVLTPGITELTRVAPAKPIIVAELASSSDIAGAVAGTTKAGWISKGYSATFNHPGWEQIVGIVYFNVNMRHHDPPHEDWRLTSPDVSPRNAYKGLLTQMRFQGTIH